MPGRQRRRCVGFSANGSQDYHNLREGGESRHRLFCFIFVTGSTGSYVCRGVLFESLSSAPLLPKVKGGLPCPMGWNSLTFQEGEGVMPDYRNMTAKEAIRAAKEERGSPSSKSPGGSTSRPRSSSGISRRMTSTPRGWTCSRVCVSFWATPCCWTGWRARSGGMTTNGEKRWFRS